MGSLYDRDAGYISSVRRFVLNVTREWESVSSACSAVEVTQSPA